MDVHTNDSIPKRNKISIFFHQLITKPVIKPPPPLRPLNNPAPPKNLKKKKKKGETIKYNTEAEGKIIRDIIITTLDPFGYSITDTLASPKNFFGEAGNAIHFKTQRQTIRNIILIKKNQPYDSLMAKESERLIRTQNYIREVAITPINLLLGSDSVDVNIRVLDAWSLIVIAAASPDDFVLDLTERNFGGLGHLFENKYNYRYNQVKDYYFTNYRVPNIKHSFISAGIAYSTDKGNYKTTTLEIDRPFYSAFTKWAGGINLGWQTYHDSIYYNDSANVFQEFSNYRQDYWLGRAFKMFKGKSEDDRTTNFILSTRYYRLDYNEKSNFTQGNLYTHTYEDTYLVRIGISTRKYRQDKFVFNYGVTEDIPIGKAYALTSGYTRKKNISYWYYGVRASWGNYFSWGHFSTACEYGTLINGSKSEQGTFFAELNYFTPLFNAGNWRLRQFIKPQFTMGINRLPTEHLTLSNDYGIRGFTSDSIYGTNRFLLLIQLQSYAPWNLIGFRFGPFFNCVLGMVSDNQNSFNKSRIYSQFGLGVLIKNDYLALNTFQFSLAFYPFIPGLGGNVYKVNRYKTYNYGSRDFNIDKPSMVVYQ